MSRVKRRCFSLLFFAGALAHVLSCGGPTDGAEGKKGSSGTGVTEILRADVKESDTWDLSSLYANDDDWEEGLVELEEKISQVASYKGKLLISPLALKKALDFLVTEVGQLEERIGYYVFLRKTENLGDGKVLDMDERYSAVSTKLGAAESYVVPELLSKTERLRAFLSSPSLRDYQIYLKKILRQKPHRLSAAEEKLLAKQGPFGATASNAFSALNNVDLNFGTIKDKEGKERLLTKSTWGVLIKDPDRDLRRRVYQQFYGTYEKYAHTLAALYTGSVQRDAYFADVRHYKSARAAALFNENIDETVYDNLVETVHAHLPTLHRYYELRRKVLGVDQLRLYDAYVSLIKDVPEPKYSYDEAVEIVTAALVPLGEEYVTKIRSGLLGERWVDRYENKGKEGGAFSAGSYVGKPYVLMNFNGSLSDVGTLAHEGGHSMHSWYSVRNNPFPHYSYTLFEAETASTVNEILLAKYLMDQAEEAGDRELLTYYIGKELDNILAAIYRQTMFAEFEDITHKIVEAGEGLTLEKIRSEYRGLLETYFGPAVMLEELSDLEGLRIPHFYLYGPFYVYKYSTSMAAATALGERLLKGGEKEREQYLTFLKSGGSRYPIEALKVAGVDMSQPDPIDAALHYFEALLDRFEALLFPN